jgi:predicted O-methyltransferase YrrM
MSENAAAGLLGAGQIRDLAGRLGVRPTKKWGQNFVIDANTVRRIVRLADLSPRDVVVEIGPGLGSLTLALLPQVGRVVAVEVDGGRLRTRATESGRGVHDAQNKENKIACLVTLSGEEHADDPQPEPPATFMQPRR